jgi:hypothetical protein
MARILIWAAMASALAACGTTPRPEPRVEIREVRIPVAVPCAKDPGPTPAFSDTTEALRAAGDIFEKVKLLLAGRDQRDARLAEVTAAIEGCKAGALP